MYPNEHFLKKKLFERMIFFSNFLEIGPDFYLVLAKVFIRFDNFAFYVSSGLFWGKILFEKIASFWWFSDFE